MASIVIREVDNTSTVIEEGSDVVFVPGFGELTTETASTYANQFVLVTTPSDFTSIYGSTPQKFERDFKYRSDCWASTAFQENSNIFSNGDYDPGYCYARGALNAGMPVIYYMVNKATPTYYSVTDTSTSTTQDTFYTKIVSTAWSATNYIATCIIQDGADATGGDSIALDNEHSRVIIDSIEHSRLAVSTTGGTTTYITPTSIEFYTQSSSSDSSITNLVARIQISASDYTTITGKDASFSVKFKYYATDGDISPDYMYAALAGVKLAKNTTTATFAQSSGSYIATVTIPTTGFDANYTYPIFDSDIATCATTSTTWTFTRKADRDDTSISVSYYTATDYTVNSIFEELRDRGTYNVKYLTTGGYPTFEAKYKVYDSESTSSDKQKFPDDNSHQIYTEMLDVAATLVSEDTSSSLSGRGDAIVLLDHTNYPSRKLYDNSTTGTSVFSVINNGYGTSTTGAMSLSSTYNSSLTSFSAMYTPWMDYAIDGISGTIALPGSFAYIQCQGTSLNQYNPWMATAGVTRGAVDNIANLLTDNILTNNIANRYQAPVDNPNGIISINAITNIKPYGQVLWGNRTLLIPDTNATLPASGFMNIRSVMCDIKKVIYTACKKYMFEQNSDILWINFKAEITPTLESMKSNSIIQSYRFTKTSSDRTKLVAALTIQPLYAVESFDITITLTDEEVSVSE